jgi:hypothetical protein
VKHIFETKLFLFIRTNKSKIYCLHVATKSGSDAKGLHYDKSKSKTYCLPFSIRNRIFALKKMKQNLTERITTTIIMGL